MLELRTMSDGMGHRLTGRPLRQKDKAAQINDLGGFFLFRTPPAR